MTSEERSPFPVSARPGSSDRLPPTQRSPEVVSNVSPIPARLATLERWSLEQKYRDLSLGGHRTRAGYGDWCGTQCREPTAGCEHRFRCTSVRLCTAVTYRAHGRQRGPRQSVDSGGLRPPQSTSCLARSGHKPARTVDHGATLGPHGAHHRFGLAARTSLLLVGCPDQEPGGDADLK